MLGVRLRTDALQRLARPPDPPAERAAEIGCAELVRRREDGPRELRVRVVHRRQVEAALDEVDGDRVPALPLATSCAFVRTSARCRLRVDVLLLGPAERAQLRPGRRAVLADDLGDISCSGSRSAPAGASARPLRRTPAGRAAGPRARPSGPKCLPTSARPCSGSSSFHCQQRAIAGVNSCVPSSRRSPHVTSRVPATASHSDEHESRPPGIRAATPTPSSQGRAASANRPERRTGGTATRR